jgi:universal stress protein A
MIANRVILHPTDLSSHAGLAYQLAHSLARQTGARLVVLHVAIPPVVMYDEEGHLIPRPKDYKQAAWEKLSKLPIPDSGVCVEKHLGDSEVVSEILREAAETRADLIIMDTLGRTGLDRLLIGSVAKDVMRRAPCAVAIVNAHLKPQGESGAWTSSSPASGITSSAIGGCS